MTTARLHPLELMEIVEQVTSYLDNEDLKQLRDVNCLWNQSCQKWINSRRQSYSSMRYCTLQNYLTNTNVKKCYKIWEKCVPK